MSRSKVVMRVGRQLYTRPCASCRGCVACQPLCAAPPGNITHTGTDRQVSGRRRMESTDSDVSAAAPIGRHRPDGKCRGRKTVWAKNLRAAVRSFETCCLSQYLSWCVRGRDSRPRTLYAISVAAVYILTTTCMKGLFLSRQNFHVPRKSIGVNRFHKTLSTYSFKSLTYQACTC